MASCEKYQQKKRPAKKAKVEMKSVHYWGGEFAMLPMDLIVIWPLPTTDKRNKHILVISDYFHEEDGGFCSTRPNGKDNS